VTRTSAGSRGAPKVRSRAAQKVRSRATTSVRSRVATNVRSNVATKAPARRPHRSAEVDAYIARFPPKVRAILEKIRLTIRKAAPGADELISYRIPAFRQRRVLLYFAAFKDHIGVFPPVRGDASLEKALARFRGPKGNLRFPLAEPIPLVLIGRMARLRARQESAQAN
jgi:uncharacterized protein YdhG (YjbR/CyaY superfamily)